MDGGEDMQMTEWNRVNAMEHCGGVEKVTDKELQREYDFHMAERLIGAMHEAGLLPDGAYEEIRRKAAETFSPISAGIA